MNYSKKEEVREVKRKIREKFRTVKHFAYSADMDYAEVNKYLGLKLGATAMDEMRDAILKKIEATDIKPFLNVILPEDREYIRRRILVNYKSVNQFITDNPQFTASFMSNVINGKKRNKDLRFKILKDVVSKLNVNPADVVGS